jgi:TonB family protein
MASHPGENKCPVPSLDPEPELRLLVDLEPRGGVFFENLGYLFKQPHRNYKGYPPAKLWSDVFVPTGLPWGRILESWAMHALAVVALITVSNAIGLLLPRAPQVRLNDKIYHYDMSYYLPPLDTGGPPAPKPRKGQPLLAKQKIISLPERPDNFEQTIISPVDVKLPANVKMPNIVAWTERPGIPSSAVTRNVSQLTVPALPADVIAPAPNPMHRDISQIRTPALDPKIIEPPPSAQGLTSGRKLQVATNVIEPPPEVQMNPRAITAPPPSVIEPPPSANVTSTMGSMNVGRLSATVAAPKLEVAEQKVITLQPNSAAGRSASGSGGGASGGGAGAPPIAPVGGMNTGQNAGQLIALNLHPAVPNGPIVVPPGRRSGEFAAGPEGTPNAPGTPDIKVGGNGPGGGGTGSAGAGHGGNGNLPAGITIGDAPGAPPHGSVVVAGDPQQQPKDANKEKGTLMASARPPRVGEVPRTPPTSTNAPTPRIEDRVFGGKQIYTLALNMPNLTSSGGSWIIRFAQLEDDHVQAPLSAPVATRTVDPAYPADLMRDGYEGVVVLYAVIHSDGTVGDVKVLRGLQTRLDENAKLALSRWKFRPGTKNGQAVELEAVVQIPFKAARNPY